MSNFISAVDVILKHEGGLSDHPSDPGGITNFGISIKFLKNELHMDVDADYVRNLTKQQAIDIYESYWWKGFKYGNLIDQFVATKVFDMSVNMGPRRAHKLAQKAANSCGSNLIVDGDLGPASFAALNSIDPNKLVDAMCDEQANFYKNLADKKPSMQVFLRGWLRRAEWPRNTR